MMARVILFMIIQVVVIMCQDEIISFVYNSMPSQVFSMSQNGSSENIKVASQANAIVVALGNAGIMYIDSQLNSITFPSEDGAYIQCLQISRDSNYIIYAMQDNVGVFELINSKQLNLISTIDTQDISVSDIEFSLDEELLFILGSMGVLRWYDIRNKSSITKLGEVVYSQMIFVKGQISPNGVYFYIAADQDGLLAFFIDKVLQSSNELQVNLKRILRKQAISSFIEVVVVSSNEYAFAIDRWNGIYTLYNLTQLIIQPDDAEDQNNANIVMQKTNLGVNAGYTSTITLSSNDLFLYVGVRSQGILLYNISDPLNPIFFQQLQLSGQSVSLRLSPKLNANEENAFDNQYIFYSNSVSVIVYQKQLPTLFRNIPNLFNLQQSTLFTDSTANSKWRCHVSSNNQYFFGAFDSDSLIIYKLNVPSSKSPESVSMQLLYQFNNVDELIEPTDKLKVFGADESIPYGFYVDTVQFSKDEQFMYFASSQYDYNVIAYKFEIIKNGSEWSFKYVQSLKHTQVYYIEQINISEDELHAVMSFDVGIVLVDMTSFEVISQCNNVGVLGTCCGAVLSHDKQHALAVVRNVGLFVYDTSNMKQPVMVNKWRTNGGETLYRSKTDQIIYLIDGFNGIILLDSTQLPQIVVISKFVVAGWSNFISFTLNEDYGILSTMDTGMLTLIDLNDKTNPRMVMQSTIKGQDSQTSCVDSTGIAFGFSPNSNGVRYFEMQSPVYIHVEREMKQTLTQQSRKLDENEAFEVGNTYLVRFLSLYRKANQILQAIYYYENLIFTDLPSWMQIDRTNQSDPNLQSIIQIDIPKESLDSNSSISSFLMIVIKTCFQLSETSFIYDTQTIQSSDDDSLLVYKYLKSSGYIDGQNCVTDFFDPTTSQKVVPLDDAFRDVGIDKAKLSLLEDYVNETLKRSTTYNQFIFDVISSLQFNQDNSNQMIIANQDQISINLSFPVINSPFIFVQKMYPDVIIYINNDQTIMKMEGTRSSINQALYNQILYFDLSKKQGYEENTDGEKILNIQIEDDFNYDLSYQLKVPQEVKFLKEKQEIMLDKNLQEQVNKQYAGASLYIEVAFLIEFNKQSFVDPDQIPLTYEFQQEISGQFFPISSDSYIKFDNVNLRLVGTPSSNELFTIARLKLVASNGYTTMSQDFIINVNQMPFSYIFNILLQVLGPFAFLIGLYRKRSSFMNIYYKKNTMYSSETAYINQMYRKKITILGNDYEIAQIFFQKYLKTSCRVLQSQGSQMATKQKIENETINLNTYQKNLADNYSQRIIAANIHLNINSSQSIQPADTLGQVEIELDQNIDPTSSKLEEQNKQQDIIINSGNQLIQEQIQNKNIEIIEEIQQNLKEQIQPNQDMLIPISKNLKKQIQQKDSNLYESDIKSFNRKITNNSILNQQIEGRCKNNSQSHNSQGNEVTNNNNSEKKHYTIIKNMVFKNDFTIDITSLVHKMLESKLTITYNLESYQIQTYKTEIENSSSRFYNCLKAVIIRYLIENDQKTQYLYRFLKKYAQSPGEYTQNDWYKLYVEILATNDTDKYGIPIPFSKTSLKEDVFFKIFKLLLLIPNNLEQEQFSYNNSLIDNLINPNLLKEVLFADALGLQFLGAKSILKCSGQSLHLENHSIISIEAYKLVENGLCMCLRRPLNLNYLTLPISKHLSLPSWMAYDCKNGVIIIEGIPSKQDLNHILIRIYDSIHFATFQFHLKIEENLNQEQQISSEYNNQSISQQQQSENNILQQSLQIQHNQRQGSVVNNSIFKYTKFAQQLKKNLIKRTKISQITLGEISTEKRQQDEINMQQEGESKEEEFLKLSQSMSELELGVFSPPLFPHSPKFQGDFLNPHNKTIQLQSFQQKNDSNQQNTSSNQNSNYSQQHVYCQDFNKDIQRENNN